MEDRPTVLVLLGSEGSPTDRPLAWTRTWAQRHPLLVVASMAVGPQGAAIPDLGHTVWPEDPQETAPREKVPPETHSDGKGRPVGTEEATTLSSSTEPSAHRTGILRRAIVIVCDAHPQLIELAQNHGHIPIVVGEADRARPHRAGDRGHSAVRRPDRVRCATKRQFADALEHALAHPIDFRLYRGPEPGWLRDRGPAVPASAPVSSALPAPRSGSGPLPLLCPKDGWPDITTIVPDRQRPEALQRTLRSLAGQDYPGRIHTIVVPARGEPDLSLTPGTKNRSVRAVPNTQSPGLAGARNSGILAAKTDYVAFCDDGDTWFPHKLRTQIDVLHAHPDTDLVCCGIRAVGERREVDHTPTPGRIVFSDLLRYGGTEVHPSTFLLRRSALVSRCGLINERIPGTFAKDYELLLRIARNGTVRACADVAVRVPWHVPSPYAEAWHVTSSTLRWLLSEYPEFGLVRSGYARVAGQVAFAEAAAGRRRTALRWIATTLRNYPLETRAYLATAIAGGVSPSAVLSTLHRRGHGF